MGSNFNTDKCRQKTRESTGFKPEIGSFLRPIDILPMWTNVSSIGQCSFKVRAVYLKAVCLLAWCQMINRANDRIFQRIGSFFDHRPSPNQHYIFD
jgi:hypothetical protein